jgi:hypothetical protein
MRRIPIAGLALVAAAIFSSAAYASAADDPFPSAKVVPVFVAAQTMTTDGAVANWFTPGSTVVFRAYAVDTKTQKLVGAKDAKYFYVAIPNAGSVKFAYSPSTPGATARMPWIAKWTVPAGYPAGIVGFKVLVKTQSKRIGQFVQMPVATSQLTISATAPATVTAGTAAAASTTDSGKLAVSLYVDSVNGTRPAATQPRPVGCTQTNVYKRGEQFVLRVWGTDVTTTDLLTSDNVSEAHYSIPGAPDVKLNWGAHGATGAKVFFWTAPWDIPTSYPLGQATVHVTFTLESGKVGTYDYAITIIP